MTYDNFFNDVDELPNSSIDPDSRADVTGYDPSQPEIIGTGTETLESFTAQEIIAQREDNPFLRLAVIGGVMGAVFIFLWGIFAFLSPKNVTTKVEETEVEEVVDPEPDYKAQLALKDQFYALEQKAVPPEEPATSELPDVNQPEPLPIAQPVPPQPVPRPVPRPAPRPAQRPVSRVASQPAPRVVKPVVPPQEQWQALANFGTGISSRETLQPRTQARPSTPNQPLLVVDSSMTEGELGILNRRRTTRVKSSLTVVKAGTTKAKIELPLVWDSSLTPEQQQSNQITVVLQEPIYDVQEKTIFDRGSTAIVKIQSINEANGLVTAYVSQINGTVFEPGQLILRNKKKSSLVAKASKRSNFSNQLLIGGVDSLSNFGEQLLESETNVTVQGSSTVVSSQNPNTITRDAIGSALDGFGSSLGSELSRRSTRNQIGDGGTIFTLSQNTTVHLINIQPIEINQP